MEILQTENEIILKFSKNIDISSFQDFFDYLTYKEAISKSQAKQEDIDAIEKEIKSEWWKKNRARLINENNN